MSPVSAENHAVSLGRYRFSSMAQGVVGTVCLEGTTHVSAHHRDEMCGVVRRKPAVLPR